MGLLYADISSNWYMLGKSLWKMHSHPDQKQSVDYREVLDAFGKAIECVPERRDSRHPDKDPILEPHYKLVSIVHKLVQRRLISVLRSSMKKNTTLTFSLARDGMSIPWCYAVCSKSALCSGQRRLGRLHARCSEVTQVCRQI